MKRLYSIQIIVVAAFLVVSFFSTLRLGAQGEDIEQDYLPSAERGPEKHVVVLIDSTRSVAIYNNQFGGPIVDVINFTQFLVRYFNLFEPDVYIGVNIFGKKGIDLKVDSQRAGEWNEQEIQSVQPIQCLERGNPADPCEDEDPSVSETMGLALDWAIEQSQPCQDTSGQVQCYILLFSDGNYREELVKERLDRIQSIPDVRIIPIAVGNYPINGPGFTGPNNIHWQRVEHEGFIAPGLDINSFYPQRSSDLESNRFNEARKGVINKLIDLLRRQEPHHQEPLIFKPSGLRLEYADNGYSRRYEGSLSPEVSQVKLQVALFPGVTVSSVPPHNQITQGLYVWDRALIEESVRFTLAGDGPVAYYYTEENITPTIDIQITPQTIYRGERITLTLALSTPYGIFDTNWIDEIHAELLSGEDRDPDCDMGYLSEENVWRCGFRSPSTTGNYTVTFDIMPSRSDLKSLLAVPSTSFSVQPDQWRYELTMSATRVEVGQPITVTMLTTRNGQPAPLPEGAAVKFKYVKDVPYMEHIVELNNERLQQLSEGVVLEERWGEGGYTLDAVIEYDPTNNVFDGDSVSFEVVAAPAPVVTPPIPQPTDTPTHTSTPETPSPTPTEEPTATSTDEIPSPTSTATSTVSPTETATVTPTVALIPTPTVYLERDTTSLLTYTLYVSMTQVEKNSVLTIQLESSEIYTIPLISTQTLYTHTLKSNYWRPRSMTVTLNDSNSITFSQTLSVPSLLPILIPILFLVLTIILVFVLLFTLYEPFRKWIHKIYDSPIYPSWMLLESASRGDLKALNKLLDYSLANDVEESVLRKHQKLIDHSSSDLGSFITGNQIIDQLMNWSLDGRDSAASVFARLLLRWATQKGVSSLHVLHYPGISKILSRNVYAIAHAMEKERLSVEHRLLWREYLNWIQKLDTIEKLESRDGMLDMNAQLRDLVLETWKDSIEKMKQHANLACYVNLLKLLIHATEDMVSGKPLLQVSEHVTALGELRQDCRQGLPDHLIPLVDLLKILSGKRVVNFIESPWENKEEHSNLEKYLREHSIDVTFEGKVFRKILLQVWLLRR